MVANHISTTTLAKRIGKDAKEVFLLLAESGWMQKIDNHWQLTEKGKFEGGIYQRHPKYGEYIAWPESIIEHPLLGLLPTAPLNAGTLGSKWGLPARLVNLVLREADLIEPFVHGWRLTVRGRALGGEQHEFEATAIPYVTWPEAILQNALLIDMVAALSAQDDLHRVFDGHSADSGLQQRVDNWLYLARVHHRANSDVYLAEQWHAIDFYIPHVRLGIILWPERYFSDNEFPAQRLQKKLEAKEFFVSQGLDIIELQDDFIDKLDEILSKELLRRGLAVY